MAIALPNMRTGAAISGGGAASGGGTAYGGVPSAISTPQNAYQQVGGVMPALPQLTKSAGDVVGAELQGQLSPGTVNFLQDKAAQFGVSMGVPGMDPGTFSGSNFLRLLGTTSEQQSQQGLQGFNSLLGALAPTQTDPGLAAEIASRNANLAAAPDPAKAAELQLKNLKDLYQLGNKGPAGGTGSGGQWWEQGNPGSYGTKTGPNTYEKIY